MMMLSCYYWCRLTTVKIVRELALRAEAAATWLIQVTTHFMAWPIHDV
jgi:hypothetical protein